jgi:hypothetical protein
VIDLTRFIEMNIEPKKSQISQKGNQVTPDGVKKKCLWRFAANRQKQHP